MTEDWQGGRTERSPWLSPARGAGETAGASGASAGGEYAAPMTGTASGPGAYDQQPYAAAPEVTYAVPPVPDFGGLPGAGPADGWAAARGERPAPVSYDTPVAGWTTTAPGPVSAMATQLPATEGLPVTDWAMPSYPAPDFGSPDLAATLPQSPAPIADDLPSADWTAAAAASRAAAPAPVTGLVPAPTTPVPYPSPASPRTQSVTQPLTRPQTQSPTSNPAPVATRPTDLMATQRVAVGTIQPRDPQPVTVEDAERILAQAVDAVHATPDMYAVGTPADGAVCLVPEDGRWSVYLADGGRRRFAGSFDDAELAAVHFAGVLLLLAQERGTLPRPALEDLPPGISADPLAEFLAGPPIEPLAADPPTSLYAERRLTVLTPGTEVDRFGDLEGNTVYAARTLYPHRSLPPEFAEREYRVYRALGPVRVLTGRAVPWFGQPGGGTVYLLPRPIRQLIREGLLEEVPTATVAPV